MTVVWVQTRTSIDMLPQSLIKFTSYCKFIRFSSRLSTLYVRYFRRVATVSWPFFQRICLCAVIRALRGVALAAALRRVCVFMFLNSSVVDFVFS